MNKNFASVFFSIIGLFGLYVVAHCITNNSQNILLTSYENGLIKYSLILTLASFSIASMIVAFLAFIGYITSDYFNAEKYEQAKCQFVVGTLSIPAWIFLYIAFSHITSKTIIFYMLYGLLIYLYISNLIVLLKKNKGD